MSAVSTQPQLEEKKQAVGLCNSSKVKRSPLYVIARRSIAFVRRWYLARLSALRAQVPISAPHNTREHDVLSIRRTRYVPSYFTVGLGMGAFWLTYNCCFVRPLGPQGEGVWDRKGKTFGTTGGKSVKHSTGHTNQPGFLR